MSKALELARKAAERGEVPVGAILVGPDGVLARALNRREDWQTPLGHAEAICLHRASKKLQNWRLEDTTLYVTLEPCLMCAGALLQARVSRVVYGARDPKGGAVESLYKVFADSRLNHQIEVTSGVLEKECSELLQEFFRNRREDHKQVRARRIPRYRSSVIVLHEGLLLGFDAVDPHNGKKYFFLPGGKIEPHENAAETAVRETWEETGYKIRLRPGLSYQRNYDFEWNGEVNACKTDFFVGALDEIWAPPGKVDDAAYNQGPRWISVKDIDRVFSYSPDILWAVRKLLKKIKVRV